MTQESETRRHIAIIGAGCAGLSLAARLTRIQNIRISLYGPEEARPDHIWGFWGMPHLELASGLANAAWQKWQIRDQDRTVTHHSVTNPYYALSAQTWLSHCQAQLKGVDHHQQILAFDEKLPEADIIADSRPNPPSSGTLLQHFLGIELQTKKATFDPDTAIVMDFRTDQSRGIHFLYVLPFTDRRALVESTYFSPEILPEHVYEADISTYLQEFFDVSDFVEIRRETGVIPMDVAKGRKPEHKNHKMIGGAGGAIRPSSGYAFGFIQKQITEMSEDPDLDTRTPHSKIDLWMDHIFLEVLHNYKALAPNLFLSMANRLSGTEFARFMSGQADLKTILKVIFAMPKIPFFLSALRVISGRSRA